MTTLILAVAASAKAAEVSGGMSLISPELITAIFTGIAAVLGVIWQKSRHDKKLAAKDGDAMWKLLEQGRVLREATILRQHSAQPVDLPKSE